MRPLIVLILLSVSTQTSIQSTLGFKHDPETVPLSAQPELTTTIVEEKYCTDGDLMLTLQFTYRNGSASKLLLLKYGVAPSNHRVSKNVTAAMAKKYEQLVSPMMGVTAKQPEFGDSPPADYFVTLEPGGSYKPENFVKELIFINSKGTKGHLKPGKYVLQVEVSSWPFPGVSDESMRRRWQNFGELWTRPVLSQPMMFEIKPLRERSLTSCNH